MGFKSLTQYTEDKYKNFFTLINDGDSADVIFLYESINDVMMADVHYIKSSQYTGYVMCNEAGCPACAKKIRTQPKIFIPLYNLNTQRIEFWDRTPYFEAQLKKDIFDPYPNPSDVIFTITRHGQPRDVNTTYEIRGHFKNTKSVAEILQGCGVTFPDYYSSVCKEVSNTDMYAMLEDNAPAPSQLAESSYQFNPVPRGTTPSPELDLDSIPLPDMDVPAVPLDTISEPPSSMPEFPEGPGVDLGELTPIEEPAVPAEAIPGDDIGDPISDVQF